MSSDEAQAGEFAELFRAVYLTFHRRDGPRSQLPNASFAVLEHLALAGPLTIGEAAAHLHRAQPVVSEIVSHLERQGMLERESDPADRRRTLIWLTTAGADTLRREREVAAESDLPGHEAFYLAAPDTSGGFHLHAAWRIANPGAATELRPVSRPDASGIDSGTAQRLLGWQASRGWRDYLTGTGEAR